MSNQEYGIKMKYNSVRINVPSWQHKVKMEQRHYRSRETTFTCQNKIMSLYIKE